MKGFGFAESIVEQSALDWLKSLGWTVKQGVAIAPGEFFAERADYGQVVMVQRLRDSLVRLNSDLPPETLDDAFRKLTRPEGATLDARNRAVHRWLVDGVTVEYRRKDGSIGGAQAQVIDFDTIENNDWLAVNQFTVSENKHIRRPDVVLFINGIPLAVLELKNAADENATIWTAFQQLQTYQHEIPSLFTYNAAVVVSDGLESRIGALGAGKVLGDDTLRTIARELVKTVRANVTIDWAVRENVRAQLRVLVKRILRKYGYPPDKQEKATLTVLEQAEVLSQEWAAA